MRRECKPTARANDTLRCMTRISKKKKKLVFFFRSFYYYLSKSIATFQFALCAINLNSDVCKYVVRTFNVNLHWQSIVRQVHGMCSIRKRLYTDSYVEIKRIAHMVVPAQTNERRTVPLQLGSSSIVLHWCARLNERSAIS